MLKSLVTWIGTGLCITVLLSPFLIKCNPKNYGEEGVAFRDAHPSNWDGTMDVPRADRYWEKDYSIDGSWGSSVRIKKFSGIRVEDAEQIMLNYQANAASEGRKVRTLGVSIADSMTGEAESLIYPKSLPQWWPSFVELGEPEILAWSSPESSSSYTVFNMIALSRERREVYLFSIFDR